jgi:hypothetical protein
MLTGASAKPPRRGLGTVPFRGSISSSKHGISINYLEKSNADLYVSVSICGESKKSANQDRPNRSSVRSLQFERQTDQLIFAR